MRQGIAAALDEGQEPVHRRATNALRPVGHVPMSPVKRDFRSGTFRRSPGEDRSPGHPAGRGPMGALSAGTLPRFVSDERPRDPGSLGCADEGALGPICRVRKMIVKGKIVSALNIEVPVASLASVMPRGAIVPRGGISRCASWIREGGHGTVSILTESLECDAGSCRSSRARHRMGPVDNWPIRVGEGADHRGSGTSPRLRTDSTSPAIMSARIPRLIHRPGGDPVLTMGLTRNINLLARCSIRKNRNRSGIMDR